MPDESTKSQPPSKVAVPQELHAFLDASIPKIYANGFSIGFTNADVQLVWKLFGRPIAVLSFSYTMAKSLAEKLTQLVREWEQKTGTPLNSMETIEHKFGMKPPEGPPK